ncbi:MAG TPA: hypothetical protein VGI90_01315 [Steroidobacteraceae bacterium]|jgi:hypothetical protein
MNKVAIASLSLLVTTLAMAYEIRHPNLRDAHAAAENAIHHVQAAQATNKRVGFGGHAEKAVDALRLAQQELAEADKWNEEHRR